jgi:ketosteroid isomerase-like protein
MSVRLVQRIEAAINAHDLEALADCFEPDYPSDAPVHPARSFRGREQMRANWAQIFAAVPDISAASVRVVADGATSAAEWEWIGHRVDGAPLVLRGVTIQEGFERATWVRFYMEEVDRDPTGVGQAIGTTVGARR